MSMNTTRQVISICVRTGSAMSTTTKSTTLTIGKFQPGVNTLKEVTLKNMDPILIVKIYLKEVGTIGLIRDGNVGFNLNRTSVLEGERIQDKDEVED